MSKPSENDKVVRRKSGEIPPPTKAELDRLRAAVTAPIDDTDAPEKEGPFRPIVRDAQGRLPQPLPELRDSPIRLAILAELGRRQMTRYELWQEAKKRCTQITSSAVYEFLRGQRAIGLPYVEALLAAAGLEIAPRPAGGAIDLKTRKTARARINPKIKNSR
jgi:hypothetical protein